MYSAPQTPETCIKTLQLGFATWAEAVFLLQGEFIQSPEPFLVVMCRMKSAHSCKAEITVHSVILCALFMSMSQSALHNSSELPYIYIHMHT
jgi:hypothetical protein